MTKCNQDQKYCTWAINEFPRDLKNRFIALAKVQNMSGGAFLEYIVAKIIRENKEKEKQT